jgi:hypothetical protein
VLRLVLGDERPDRLGPARDPAEYVVDTEGLVIIEHCT